MSRANVELVRSLYTAVNRRDTEAVLALYDPQVVWDCSRSPLGRVTGASVYRGHDGVRTAFREWYEGWGQVDDDVNELIDAGDHVVAVATIRGRGRSSGIEVEWSESATVWTVRDERIIRVVWFASRDEALEAAGLAR